MSDETLMGLLQTGVGLRRKIIQHRGRGRRIIFGDISPDIRERIFAWCDSLEKWALDSLKTRKVE